jgi:hypothetical protein
MKTINVLAAMLTICVAAAQAQQTDQTGTSTSNTNTPQPVTTTTPQPPGSTTQQNSIGQPSQQYQYRTEDRVTVPSSDLPSGLRQTLQGDQYKGWENSTIYQDRATGNYYYQSSGMPPTGSTTSGTSGTTGYSSSTTSGNTGTLGTTGSTTTGPQPTNTTTGATGTLGTSGSSVTGQQPANTTGMYGTPNNANNGTIYSFDRTGTPLNNTGVNSPAGTTGNRKDQ